MRIITGTAKGIKLKTLEGDATRPTSERVKEAVFSMIQFDIEGRDVLDLFAGSGQLALEAVSRGARSAVLVDRSRAAVRIIKENVAKARMEDACSVIEADFLNFLLHSAKKKYDIIFLDPPYAQKMYVPALRAMLDADLLKPTSLIICESGEDTVFEGDAALASKFEVVKQSKYSKTFITVFRPAKKGNEYVG